eukprot:INCI19276.2.p1 GENE.INCI19276.2~~INCI19276.2.p1  ORF type:complete len:313 (+),score=51.74 INCI19276.2:133-939(+)
MASRIAPKVVNEAAKAAGITGGEALVAFTLGYSASQQTAAKAVLDGCTLTYFPIAARGEAVRLMLTLAGIKFTDERIEFPQWQGLKPKTPWGSLPYLTLADGTVLGQSQAINRFVARLTGFYPADPLQAAHVDAVIDGASDLVPAVMKVGVGLDQAAKEAARLEACKSGAVGALLSKIEGFVTSSGKDGHAVGDSLTLADIFLFAVGTAFVSGTFDGVPEDLFAAYPNIEGVRKTVAAHPDVIAYYAGRTDSGSQFHKKVVQSLNSTK